MLRRSDIQGKKCDAAATNAGRRELSSGSTAIVERCGSVTSQRCAVVCVGEGGSLAHLLSGQQSGQQSGLCARRAPLPLSDRSISKMAEGFYIFNHSTVLDSYRYSCKPTAAHLLTIFVSEPKRRGTVKQGPVMRSKWTSGAGARIMQLAVQQVRSLSTG